jgi:hypothetical protein
MTHTTAALARARATLARALRTRNTPAGTLPALAEALHVLDTACASRERAQQSGALAPLTGCANFAPPCSSRQRLAGTDR